MTDTARLEGWLGEIKAAMDAQPETTWTLAKFRIALPSARPEQSLIKIDNVTATGVCNVEAVRAMVDDQTGRVKVVATFADFDMRGVSDLIGRFQVVLPEQGEAVGWFVQRYPDSLYPLHGTWRIPFLFKSDFGDLVQRPTDPPMEMLSAEPGLHAIPPIGSWFENWDPVALVRADDPDGPTVAVVEHAMHVVVNAGDSPTRPPFQWE